MNIEQTFAWYYNFKNAQRVQFREESTKLDCVVELSKTDKGLTFELHGPHFKLLYEQDTKFILFDNFYEIHIKNYISSKGNSIISRICNAYIFQSSGFHNSNKVYYKYFSKINNPFLLRFIKNEDLVVKTSFGIFSCKIYQIYSHKGYFLTIECENMIDFSSFKNIVNSIIVAIGFITGHYYRQEEFYFQSSNQEFDNVDFFCKNGDYNRTILEPFTYAPQMYKDVDTKEFATYITVPIFNKLVNLLVLKPTIYSALINLFNIYQGYPLSTITMSFMILEAICDELNKGFFDDQIKKNSVKEEGLAILESIKSSISIDNYSRLRDVVESVAVDYSSNNVKIERAFKRVGANLSNEERTVLKQRNKIFHGVIVPSKMENSEDHHYELESKYSYYSFRLYILIAKLILKEIGFSGYIINHPKVKESIISVNVKESNFIKI